MSTLTDRFESELTTTTVAPVASARAQIPGSLQGAVTLTLQTAFAQRLVEGRRRAEERGGVLGLFSFAELLRRIWYAAAAADPYADWWLLKVERALARADTELQQVNRALLDRLEGLEALVVEPAASVSPVSTALAFTTAQAFRGAQLIARADGVARTALTARHVGCVPAREAAYTLWRIRHVVRGAFGKARGFVSTGISRDDLRKATPRAAYAVQAMGVLPDVVLQEIEMPANYPRGRRRTGVVSPATHGHDLPVIEVDVLDDESFPADVEASDFEDDLADLFPSS